VSDIVVSRRLGGKRTAFSGSQVAEVEIELGMRRVGLKRNARRVLGGAGGSVRGEAAQRAPARREKEQQRTISVI